MTVVSLLRLNSSCGMGCADEREVHYVAGAERSYDLPKKIHILGQSSFVGFSGTLPNADEILEKSRKALRANRNASLEDVKNVLKESYVLTKNQMLEEAYLRRYNLTIEDITQNQKTNPEIVKEALNSMRDPRNFGVTALVGGYGAESGFKIFEISYPGSEELCDKKSIGSGAETADRVISMRLSLMNPDQRKDIPKYVGANILMEATRAAWRNSGVGGITQLVWCDGEKVKELGWRESNVLNNVLYLQEREKVGKPLVDDMFKGVIESGEDYKGCLKLLSGDTTFGNLKKADILSLFMVDSLLG